MKKAILSLPCTCLLGILFGIARGYELYTTYDPTTGLQNFGLINWIFLGSLLAVVILELVLRKFFRKYEVTEHRLIGTYKLPLILFGLFMIAQSAVDYLSWIDIGISSSYQRFFLIALAVSGLIAGLCMILLSLISKKVLNVKGHPGLALLILPYTILRVVYFLWSYSVDPTVDSFILTLAAVLLYALVSLSFVGLAYHSTSLYRLQALSHLALLITLAAYIGNLLFSFLHSGLSSDLTSFLLSNLEIVAYMILYVSITTLDDFPEKESPVEIETIPEED